MMLTHAQIAALIPHAGAMCLLDQVESWDARDIVCLTRRHRELDNPLRRRDGRLGALAGIELAGQAAALHGAFAASPSAKPRRGVIASLRDIRLSCALLDAVPALTVTATLVTGDSTGATYQFAVADNAAPLLTGRFTILFGGLDL